MSALSGTQVSSWDELVAHLRAQHVIEDREGGGIRVRVGDAPEPIDVRPIEVLGAPWVEIIGSLAKQLRHIAPAPILARNFILPMGITGMLDGVLMVRQLLPLQDLQTTAVDQVMAFLAAAIMEAQTR